MSRIVRAVLVWVLAIAMPVQGLAASTMLFCGPGHAQMAVSAHDHATHGDHATAPSPAVDVDGGSGLDSPHGKFSCSACAACCSVLALPVGFSLPNAVSPSHPARAVSTEPVSSQPPDGLERPPRVLPD